MIHDGFGRVHEIIGGQPGSENDINIVKKSDIYRNPTNYLKPGHVILSDLAFYYIGYPFLCRIAYQEHYSALEIAYNRDHSHCRVITENFYGRFKKYWNIFELYTFKMDKIDIHVRAFVILTNIIITYQSPLRDDI